MYIPKVSFEKRVSGEGEEEEVVKVVKKTLFQRSNAYPQKKVLTFNRYSKDFPFSVYYSHLGFLSDDEKTYVSLKKFGCLDFVGETCPLSIVRWGKIRAFWENCLSTDNVKSCFELHCGQLKNFCLV